MDDTSIKIWEYLSQKAMKRERNQFIGECVYVPQIEREDICIQMKEWGLDMHPSSLMNESQESPRDYMNNMMVFSKQNTMFWKERYKEK